MRRMRLIRGGIYRRRREAEKNKKKKMGEGRRRRRDGRVRGRTQDHC